MAQKLSWFLTNISSFRCPKITRLVSLEKNLILYNHSINREVLMHTISAPKLAHDIRKENKVRIHYREVK